MESLFYCRTATASKGKKALRQRKFRPAGQRAGAMPAYLKLILNRKARLLMMLSFE